MACSDRPRKMQQGRPRFNVNIKHCQSENSLSYCVLSNKLRRSERPFKLFIALTPIKLEHFMKGCHWNDSLSKKKRRSRLVRRENILIFLTTTTVGQCLRLYQKFHFKITFIRSIFQSFETTLKKLQFRYNGKLTLQFATRGYCTTGKH